MSISAKRTHWNSLRQAPCSSSVCPGRAYVSVRGESAFMRLLLDPSRLRQSRNHRKAREKGAEHADYRFSLECNLFSLGEVRRTVSLFALKQFHAAKWAASSGEHSLDPS